MRRKLHTIFIQRFFRAIRIKSVVIFVFMIRSRLWLIKCEINEYVEQVENNFANSDRTQVFFGCYRMNGLKSQPN